MGPFDHQRYNPGWRRTDPVVWRLLYPVWRLAAYFVLLTIGAFELPRVLQIVIDAWSR